MKVYGASDKSTAFYTGWRRDLPDRRDFDERVKSVASILAKSTPLKAARANTPSSVDLREWFSPVENQFALGSCTANAGVGLVEYFQRRTYGEYINGSRLFLYKATRNLDGWTGDTGAYMRTTMKALALFGAPPEKHYPYIVEDFDLEPPAFCYAYGQSYRAIEYYRLDPHSAEPEDVLQKVKEFLAGGLPSMFGFTVYSSMPGAGDGKGEIPFPGEHDSAQGGHAVVAVGYDDAKKIGQSKGAILIRNSWGQEWGDNGYGWLPYDYILEGQAVDFWSLVDADFVSSDLFKKHP